jgi:lipopolysaccharide/colanic/teichoic acid biosynthesis glycosyltransferase
MTVSDLRTMTPILPWWQRVFDVLIAGAALLVLLPVLAGIAVAIRLNMGRPVFFRQVRPGLLGRDFTLVKFRTMKIPAGPVPAGMSPDVARITRLGGFLRKTSLDELPELWAILSGRMSLVGPRPLLQEYLDFYSSTELKRFLVRPGLTGLAQVSGRNMVEWERRLGLDVEFVENICPRLYFSILARTVTTVARADGVSVDSYSVAKPLHIERSASRSDRMQLHE